MCNSCSSKNLRDLRDLREILFFVFCFLVSHRFTQIYTDNQRDLRDLRDKKSFVIFVLFVVKNNLLNLRVSDFHGLELSNAMVEVNSETIAPISGLSLRTIIAA